MINKDLLDSAADSLFYNLFDLRRVGVPGRQNHIRRLGHQMDHIADFLLEISLFIRQCDRPLLKRHPGRGKCSSRFVEFHVLPRRNRGQPDDFDPELMAASTTYGLTPPTELFRAMLPNIRNGDPLNKYRWIWSHAGAEL